MLDKNKAIKRIDLNGIMRATVINNVDDRGGEGRIAVAISKLMPTENVLADPTPPKSEDPMDKSILENPNDNSYAEKIQIINHYWVRPSFLIDTSPIERTVTNEISNGKGFQKTILNEDLRKTKYISPTGEYRIPRIGTEVYIFFEDKDPQKGYYLPFSPTLDGQVTLMDEIENKDNVENLSKKVNLHIMREFQNGNIIYADTNDDTNTFTIKFQDKNYGRHLGHRLKFEMNEEAEGIVLETQYGHQFMLIDKSNNDGSKDSRDSNDEDGLNKGKYIKLRTPKGHVVILDDNDGKEKITVDSKSGHQLVLDDVADTVHLHTQSGTTIDMHQGKTISIHTGATAYLTAGGNVTVDAPRVDLNPASSGARREPIIGQRFK